MWRNLAVAAALLIVVGGFAQIFIHHSTSTPTQATKLSWRAGSIPSGIADLYARTDWRTLPIAPSDGSTIYGCDFPSIQQTVSSATSQVAAGPAVWVSHDRALHWQQVGRLPITRADLNVCYLTVDTLNPGIVIAVAAWGAVNGHPTSGQTASFVTFTGGQTWRPLSDASSAQIARFTTNHGVTYAYFDGVNSADRHLMVSANGMQTWHAIDQAIVATGQSVLDFTVAPDGVVIWAQAGKDGVPTRSLWVSRDAGQTWSPQPGPTAEQYVFGAGSAPTLETICASEYDGSRIASAPNLLSCSEDGGGHWNARLGLNIPASVVTGPAHVGQSAPIQLLGVASDGSVLALDDGSATPTIYRLANAAQQWRLIGALPVAARMVVVYYPQPGTGVLWASSAGAQPVQPTSMVYTTNYP
ncbi:MAG: WD40/YVTN/BNR-like repeat-containing protein [Ktedonobacterales bacterium]